MLRIYPTYVLGLALQLAVLLVASRIWGHPLPYDWKTILANAFLVHDLASRPSIDLVNWTLTIELRFYLLVAVLAPWIRRGRLAAVFGPAVLACIAALALSEPAMPSPGTLGFLTSGQLPFLVMMLAGVLFNYHVRGKLGTAGLLAGVLAMAGLTVFAWWFGVLRGQFTYVLINYAYALVLFSILYGVRRHVPSNRLLGGLAAISYPLYLVHATLGFFVLKAFMLLVGIGYIPALCAALLTTIAAAFLLHVVVERPSIAWGHRLARRSASQQVGSNGLAAPELP